MQDILEYSIGDMLYLPRLWNIYNQKLNLHWRKKLEAATVARLALARDPNFRRGAQNALGPW